MHAQDTFATAEKFVEQWAEVELCDRAAKELNERRERWRDPPEWLNPIAARIDAADDFGDVPADARPLIRQSAIMAAAAKDARLKKRTLTNLYSERPTRPTLDRETLDRAALSPYGPVDPEERWSDDWATVWVDKGAGQPFTKDHSLEAERRKVDQLVLGNLLRMNGERGVVARNSDSKTE